MAPVGVRWPPEDTMNLKIVEAVYIASLRRAGGRAAAAAGTSPGPGLGIKAASSPGGALHGGRVSFSMGEGAGHPCPHPVEFLFYQSIFFIFCQFLCH